MKSHSELGGNTKDDAETDTKQQGDHGGIIVRAEIPGDEDSCPDSDEDDYSGYNRADYTGDDDVVGPARNIFGKSR